MCCSKAARPHAGCSVGQRAPPCPSLILLSPPGLLAMCAYGDAMLATHAHKVGGHNPSCCLSALLLLLTNYVNTGTAQALYRTCCKAQLLLAAAVRQPLS